jgi:ribosomal protein L30/L7E
MLRLTLTSAIVVYNFNPAVKKLSQKELWELKASLSTSRVPGHPGLHRKTAKALKLKRMKPHLWL